MRYTGQELRLLAEKDLAEFERCCGRKIAPERAGFRWGFVSGWRAAERALADKTADHQLHHTPGGTDAEACR